MPDLKKITVIRHNLLGSLDENREGVILNEIFYDGQGNEVERLNYNTDGELEERINTKVVNGRATEEQIEVDGAMSERVARTFDEKGKVLTETRYYQEGGTDTATYQYNGEHLVMRLVVDSDGEEGEKAVWEYDGDKLMREVRYDIFGKIEIERVHEYDEAGRISEITETSYRDGDPEQLVSVFDEQGRLITEKRYDSKKRLVARTIITYNEEGKPLQYEEENSRGKKITKMEYDAAGNNILQEETNYNGDFLNSTERTFDEDGQLLTVEIIIEPSLYQPGQHYKLEYNYEFSA